MSDRNPVNVIELMLKHVPAHYEDLRQDMEWLMRSATYKAPEQMLEIWHALQRILIDGIGRPDCAWKESVVEIMRGS